MTNRIIGCPHEEGIDCQGPSCPSCPSGPDAIAGLASGYTRLVCPTHVATKQGSATDMPAPIKPTLIVEAVATSNKLIRVKVDFGDHLGSILVGMKKERQNPNEITGRQALFVVNLQSRKMAGEISEGMLFDIGYSDNITPVLVSPEKPVPNGTRAG